MDLDKLFVDGLSDLWNVDFQAESHSIAPLEAFEFPKRARTMLCHDMKGGYLEQERTVGVARPTEEPIYLFMNWWNVDVFVYFSHHLVTIPPIGWTNSAHQHGVQILGTFITEFDDGVNHCAELFADRDSVDRTVQKLVDAAVAFEFDGWLVNIENKVQAEHLDWMGYFLMELQRKMHKAKGGKAMVVWYDSVTVDGELKWQDELNEKNRKWFDCVDAIYLNYCWNEDKLARSRAAAGERASDVYAGVDCFGRGCFGGGQWNCREALKAIQNENLSCALFAPGWIAECFPECCILEQSMKFWNQLTEFLPCRSMFARNFATTFRNGLSEEKFCISEGELQPIFASQGGSGLTPLSSATGGVKVKKGTHTLFYFARFPKKAKISISTSDGDASLRFPESVQIDIPLPGVYLINSLSDACEIQISTSSGCVLERFELQCDD